jgi:propanol-preferring alcohol dehydrogenase
VEVWEVHRPGPLASGPLRRATRPDPRPGPGQLLVEVRACGVCRTDLHVAEGDLPVHRPAVVPGHQVVGRVLAAGPGASRFSPGDRVGVAWLAWTCGRCRACRLGRENLCPEARFTGWDLDGGYAERLVAEEAFVYRLPEGLSDLEAAPLLCAGIIGYRALRRAELPPAGRLGIYGFGSSAHLTAQLALRQGAEVHVVTRSEAACELALALGCASAHTAGPPPVPLDAALVFAPAGPVLADALAALAPGGVAVSAGIHLSDLPPLSYQRHLFQERDLRSVTANTRADGEAFLALAARLGVRATTTAYGFEEADRALADLAGDRLTGSAVIRLGSEA